jgi:hypothetical protein
MECPQNPKHEEQAGSCLASAWNPVWVSGQSAAGLDLVRLYRSQGRSIIPDSVTLPHDLDSMMMKPGSYEVWTRSAYE